MDDPRSRKISLLQEFNTTIAPQKLQLEKQLPSLWKLCYGPAQIVSQAAPAAQPVNTAAVKRAPEAVHAPEPKRPRSEEVDRRVEMLFKDCLNIITKKLWGIKNATWFKKPVDTEALGIPNYHLFVKHPMDLGTIKSKLQAKAYNSVLEFRDDVNLVWSNCAAYNQEGTHARMAGDQCKATWERAWRDSHIEEQWQQLQFELDPVGAPLHERVGALNTQLVKAVEIMPRAAASEMHGRDMTFAEKRRLSMRLGQIQSTDQYQAVLDILAKDPRVSMAADGDVEVEIDDLKSDTLWKLQDLLDRPGSRPVAAQSKPVSKPSPAAAPRANAMAEKALPRGRNGTTSVQSSGAGGAASGAGSASEESGQHSPREVEGSNMDEAKGASAFVRSARDAGNMVDESATAPKEQSLFVKDRTAARKADVNINTANWNSLTTAEEDAAPKAAQPEAGDDMWKSFQSIAEQKQKKEEMQRQEMEKAEKLRREEQERQQKDEEERKRKLREEEERQQAEMQKEREQQMQKELAEIQSKAGTANLTQQSEVAILANLPAPSAEGLAALGLEYHDADEDMNFEDND